MLVEQLAEGGSGGRALLRQQLQPALDDQAVALEGDQLAQPALDCLQRLLVLALPPCYLEVQQQPLRSSRALSV